MRAHLVALTLSLFSFAFGAAQAVAALPLPIGSLDSSADASTLPAPPDIAAELDRLSTTSSLTLVPVSEPATLVLTGIGLSALVARFRYRGKRYARRRQGQRTTNW